MTNDASANEPLAAEVQGPAAAGETVARGPGKQATPRSAHCAAVLAFLDELLTDDNPRAESDLPHVEGYEVLEQLGRGGMGVVFKARHLALDRLVALKMILAAEWTDSEMLERFRAEAQAVAQLKHPHIVQVYESGTHEGRPFISLELCEGGSLHAKLAGKPLSSAEAARVTQKLARAVHAAHQQRIIHRDLKPHNVLLAHDGEPKITDFGLAKKLDTPAGRTQVGAVVGTPSYMAPEQARGDVAGVGPLADVYSLGAMLYEFLTGRPPFLAANSMDVLDQVMHDDPVPPRRLQSRVPRDLETICLKCLQKEPRQRYASAEQLADDLKRWLAGEPIRARPVGLAERAWRWCRRNPLPASLVAGIVLVFLMGFAGVFWEWRVAAAARDNEQNERKQTESLVVQLRFADAIRQPEENRAWSMLTAADLLRDAIALKNQPLEKSLRLHLGSWFQDAHRLKCTLPHDNVVNAVAFSPDGKRVLTGSWDGTARLWDASTHEQVGPPLPHANQVVAVAFSPDGKTVLTGSVDHTARLWDTATGKPLFQDPLQHKAAVQAVAFSPDGKTLLTGSQDHTAQLWDASTGKRLGAPLPHVKDVMAVAFSPDGRTVLTGSYDGTVWLWEPATGNSPKHLPRHPQAVRAVAFSPDGKRVLTGSEDAAARLWEVDTGELLGLLQHEATVVALAFSRDGKTILTGSQDRTARLWDASTYKLLGPPLKHQGYVWGVAFSWDGKTILTGSQDKTARMWEMVTSGSLGRPLQYGDKVCAMAISPDGRTVLTGSEDGTVQLWETATGKPLLQHPLQHDKDVLAVAFSPDGKTMLTGSADQRARLWDASTGKPLGLPLEHRHWIRAVAFSPDGKTILTGSMDGSAQLWETATGRPFGPPLKHDGHVIAVAFSPEGKAVLTGGWDHTARLWEVTTGKLLETALEHGGYVIAVAFSPDGKSVLTGSADRTARLWDPSTRKQLVPPMRHQTKVNLVAFSPDGNIILTRCADNTVWLWETATGQPLGSPQHYPGRLLAAVFSPDGKTVLTGSSDGTTRLWRVPTPIEEDPERILLWAQVITGLELDEQGGTRGLDAAIWEQRRQRLQELGGPP